MVIVPVRVCCARLRVNTSMQMVGAEGVLDRGKIMIAKNVQALLAVFTLISFGMPLAFAEVGTAVDVDQTSRVTSGGGASTLQSGSRVSAGDTIQTSGRGQVQIRFDDNTKIVVGPNSRFTVADVRLNNANRANRFAVNAVRGSYRFISGRSPKNVFSVRTPSATIGIRGTTFDFEVGNETAVAVLRGRVEVCGANGRCEIVGARCTLVVARRDGNVEVPPLNEAAQIVRSGFPYIANQRPTLQPAFRAPVNACSRYDNARRAVSTPDDTQGRLREERERGEPRERETPVEEEEQEEEEEEEEEENGDGPGDETDGPILDETF